jgi:4-amino-4-deoxy-L-arabinose transferase-like glycosyltransferase
MSSPSVPLPSRLFDARARNRSRAAVSRRPELLALLVLAALLNLWGLSRNGFANEYYSAAVRSMSTSWHAFLYGSFDRGGLMTVDKPPLALWVQALSVRAFGFGSWSILVPQALMGVATTGLAYDLTRRHFGRVAGFVAGLVLVLTPVTVAVSRHNNPDALLALCCTAALWCLVRGLQDGRTRWLVAAGVCVGLGFEAKMAAALMVVPAIAVAWLWIAPRGRLRAVRQLFAGAAAMVAVGAAWPLLVALTPAADRPWVSGTADNSIWSLIMGYNGLGRIFGQSGGPGAGAGGGAGGPGAGGFFGGEPGPLRLLNASLGGQGGWLLGFAVVAGLGLLAMTRLRRADARTGWLIAVGGAFAVTALAFSQAAGIFHPYYVSLLAPFGAALVGAGTAQILEGDRAARVLEPAYVLVGVLSFSGRCRAVISEGMTFAHLVDAIDGVLRRLGGTARAWRTDRMATVVIPGSDRITAQFAQAAPTTRRKQPRQRQRHVLLDHGRQRLPHRGRRDRLLVGRQRQLPRHQRLRFPRRLRR